MKLTVMLITATSLAALAPLSVSAQDAVAASLSASFGDNLGLVSTNVNNTTGDILAPQSVSVSGAAGLHVASSSVANATATGAASVATGNNAAAPRAVVTLENGSLYETTVNFGPMPTSGLQPQM